MVRIINKDKTLDTIDEAIRKALKSYIKVIGDPIKNIPGEVEEEQAKEALIAIDMLDKEAFKHYIKTCGYATLSKGRICEMSRDEMREALEDLRKWGKKGKVPKKVRKALSDKK